MSEQWTDEIARPASLRSIIKYDSEYRISYIYIQYKLQNPSKFQ